MNHINDINCNCHACYISRQKQSVLALTSLGGLGNHSVDYEQRQRLYKNEEYKKTQEDIIEYKDLIEVEKAKLELIKLKEEHLKLVKSRIKGE